MPLYAPSPFVGQSSIIWPIRGSGFTALSEWIQCDAQPEAALWRKPHPHLRRTQHGGHQPPQHTFHVLWEGKAYTGDWEQLVLQLLKIQMCFLCVDSGQLLLFNVIIVADRNTTRYMQELAVTCLDISGLLVLNYVIWLCPLEYIYLNVVDRHTFWFTFLFPYRHSFKTGKTS